MAVNHSAEFLTPLFLEYLVHLHEKFMPRITSARQKRLESVNLAVNHGIMPGPLPTSHINTTDWSVPIVPEDLLRPGIEISGPASGTPMFINALIPAPDGTRAEGYLDDDEDSASHCLLDTIVAARNRLGAIERTLTYTDNQRGRKYVICLLYTSDAADE